MKMTSTFAIVLQGAQIINKKRSSVKIKSNKLYKQYPCSGMHHSIILKEHCYLVKEKVYFKEEGLTAVIYIVTKLNQR